MEIGQATGLGTV